MWVFLFFELLKFLKRSPSRPRAASLDGDSGEGPRVSSRHQSPDGHVLGLQMFNKRANWDCRPWRRMREFNRKPRADSVGTWALYRYRLDKPNTPGS